MGITGLILLPPAWLLREGRAHPSPLHPAYSSEKAPAPASKAGAGRASQLLARRHTKALTAAEDERDHEERRS